MAINNTYEQVNYTSSNVLNSMYIVHLFLRMLRNYDHDLYGHSIRVSRYAYTLANKLNLSESVSLDIAIGSILHDIGKIEIPLNILNKKEKLTLDEWELMKQHPITGHKMLFPFRTFFSSTVLNMVKYHHCKLDSSGYPNNIHPDELSTAVRILTISDSYDAMINTRRYSTAKTKNEAISELIMYSNTQFDAHIASHFIEFLQSELPLLSLPYNLA